MFPDFLSCPFFCFLLKKLLDDEEEMSELQLRLLALQSASKKWQQKEQQVMKESKEKLTKTKSVTQKIKASTKAHSTKKPSTTGNKFNVTEMAVSGVVSKKSCMSNEPLVILNSLTFTQSLKNLGLGGSN